MQTFHKELGDNYRPAHLLVTLVKVGRLGRKTGRGVYDYRKWHFMKGTNKGLTRQKANHANDATLLQGYSTGL